MVTWDEKWASGDILSKSVDNCIVSWLQVHPWISSRNASKRAIGSWLQVYQRNGWMIRAWSACRQHRKEFIHQQDFSMYMVAFPWIICIEYLNCDQTIDSHTYSPHYTAHIKRASKKDVRLGQFHTAYKWKQQLKAAPARLGSTDISILNCRQSLKDLFWHLQLYLQEEIAIYDLGEFFESRPSQFWQEGFYKLTKLLKKIA